jgi:hypothetical protein
VAKRQYMFLLLLIGILTLAGAVIGSRMVLAQSAQGQNAKALEQVTFAFSCRGRACPCPDCAKHNYIIAL